jgi:hypothetical protein
VNHDKRDRRISDCSGRKNSLFRRESEALWPRGSGIGLSDALLCMQRRQEGGESRYQEKIAGQSHGLKVEFRRKNQPSDYGIR